MASLLGPKNVADIPPPNVVSPKVNLTLEEHETLKELSRTSTPICAGREDSVHEDLG
jgi:hypothetical protein